MVKKIDEPNKKEQPKKKDQPKKKELHIKKIETKAKAKENVAQTKKV